MSDYNPPRLGSMKISHGDDDAPTEPSTLPMLGEMAIDALQSYANYEQREPLSMATQVCRCTINGEDAIAVVIVTVAKPDRVERDIAHALTETIKNLP